MYEWRELLLYSFFLCILSTYSGVSGSISSSEVSLTDLRSKLDDMLINALKAHTFVPNSEIGNREELRLNDVVRDVDTFGDFPSVRRWYSLSTLDTVYLLGLTEEPEPGLVAITLDQNKTNKKNDSSQVVSVSNSSIALSYRVSNAAIFQWWNSTSREMETICVIAINSPEKDLKWYRFVDRKLVEFWSWTIHKTVNNLQIFTDERYVKLVLVNEAPSNTIAMYDINLGFKPDFSLSQIIHFESAIQSFAISFVGQSIFMSVPQSKIDAISVFKLDTPTMLHSQFHPHENLTCKGVRDVTAFNTGYQSYLAVLGDVTMIYLFKFNGELVKDLIINLGTVAKWAPIKLATFRDDILLMARKNDDSDIYFLGWRGSDKGFTKLIGSDSFCSESQTKAWQEMCSISKLGWAGATSFLLGGVDSAVAFFLIPNIEGGSSLFRLITSFNPVKNPIIWELEVLKKRKDFIQDLLDEQKDKVSNLEEKLMKTLRANATNFVTGSWKINHISTSCLERGANFSVRDDEIDPDNNPKKSEKSSLEKLKKIVDNYKKASEFVMNDQLMKDAILKTGKVTNRVVAKSNTIIESADIENSLNGMSIADLLNGTYRMDRPRKVMGVKTVKNLRADNLNTSNISNRSFDDFIFSGDVIEIDHSITFSNDVNVDNVILPEDGKVNGIDLSRDLLTLNDHQIGTLHFEDLQTEILIDKSSSDVSNGDNLEDNTKPDRSLSVKVTSGRNFTVNKLNGRLWSEIVDSAIWKNKNEKITGAITVKGRVTARGSLFVEKDETLVKNVKILHVKEKDADDFNEFEKYNHQYGNRGESTVFEGDIIKNTNKSARCISRKYLLMQKLKSARYLKGDFNLRGNLFVDGMLHTTKKNSQEWSDQVKSIILKTDRNPVINESKHFHQLTVEGNLNAKKNINGYDLSSFMTKDSEQRIPGSKTLEEHVVFENINLNGTWDGVNITDLYRNSIRLSNNQSLPDLHLIVEGDPYEGDARSRITTSSLTVTSEHRKPRMEVSPRSDIDESENNVPGFDVEKINFKEIEVMGSLFVEKRVAGYNFKDFMTKRVSLREKDNVITGNYSFKRIDADHLTGNSINGQPISKLKKGSVYDKTSTGKGFTDVLHIEELHLYGNIKTRNGVSGFNVSKISETAFFLNNKNCAFNGTFQFEEEVTFEGLHVEGLVSGINLTEFLHDTVRSNENNTKITSKKVFEKGLNIEGDLNLTLLNGLKVEDILTRSSNQTLKTKLITKNINFSDKTDPQYLKVGGLLNGMNFNELKKNWKYSDNGVSQWYGNLSFGNDIIIDNITVEGYLLGTDITKFVENVYMKSKNFYFLPSVIFENDVSVLGDIFISMSYNDMNVEEYRKNVVFTTEVSDVKGNVSFTGKVVVSKDLRVYNNLEPKTLYGCDVEEWKNNAIYINKFRKNDLPIPGKIRFHKVTVGGKMKTDLIDDVDLNKAVLLNKYQTIDETLKFSKVVVTNNVEVGRLVNGMHLQEEYGKTLLIEGDQVVGSSCNFLGEFEVLSNLETMGSVNGKLLKNTATLDGNHTIHDNLTFKCIIAKNEIDTNDSMISGINIEDWHRRAFLKDTDQSVLGDWNVGGNVTFEKPLKGSLIFNGVNLTRISNELDKWRKDQANLHSETSSNFTNECSDIAVLVKKSRQQVLKLRHFETLQRISLDSGISSVHYFDTRTGYFLVVSFSSSCRIFIYKWNKFTERFMKSYEQLFRGPVEEWNTLKFGGKTFLIAQTKKDSPESNVTCSSNGVATIWEFDDLFGQLHFARELKDYGEILGTDEKLGYLYTFKDEIVSKWAFESVHSPPKLSGTMKKEEIGFSRVVGSFTFEVNILSKLARTNDRQSNIQFWDEPALQNEFSLHPQAKFLAVSTADSPEIGNSEFVSIYRQNGSLFEKIPALQPFALTWIQFSQHTLLAFMDGNSTLQIYGLQSDGDEGFVRLISTHLPSRGLQVMLLPISDRTNRLPTLLTYNENEIKLISGNLAGSVYEGILPDCSVDEGL